MDGEELKATDGLSGVKVPLHQLVASLGLPGVARKQLKRIKKDQKVLGEAPPSFEQARIRRIIGYEGAVKEMSKWEPVIKENRKSKVIFPENSSGPSIKLTPPIAKITKPQNQLEEQMSQLLKENHEFLPDKKELSAAEEKALQAKSLQEAKLLRAELMKQKALMSYYNAKMRRQNKIKSKSYRKIMRKSKEGNQAKYMELMKHSDPEAYREWLKKEERKRIEERMTQKHGPGSRAMTKKTRYAKYDDKTRAVVQDMNDMRKELSRKIPTLLEELEELEDEDDDDDDDVGLPTDEVMSRKQVLDDSDASSGEAEGVEEDDILKAVKAKAVEIESINIDQKAKSWESVSKKQRGSNAIRKRKQCKEPEVNVDPLAFKSVEKTLSCGSGAIDLVIENEEDFSAGEKRKRLTIAEAFEDDNVIEEFIQEKRNTVDQDKPKDIDLTLEGWGTWTGIGIQTSKRKRRRFTVKTPAIPRKDKNLANVIISETKDSAVTKHQVSALPHPYRNVVEFEKQLKKPIGKQWNPESKYRQNIKPSVVTRLGSIIKPISSSCKS